MIHIIIDGYNLIRQVPSLSRHENLSLEEGRKKLIQLLSRYKKIKRHKISVIFDGVLNLSEFAPAYKEAGIQVRFSPQNSSADEIIAEMSQKEKDRAIVVSSDQAILRQAHKYGSGILTSPDFYDKLLMATTLDGNDSDVSDKNSSPKHKRWLTYKKGPSKRAPKKHRKHRQRIKKL